MDTTPPQTEIERLQTEIERLQKEKRKIELSQEGKQWRGTKTVSRKSHGKLSNPNPVQNDQLKAKQFKAMGEDLGKLGKKKYYLRLPEDVEEFVESLEQADRVGLMRLAVVEKARELMNEQDPQPITTEEE